MNRWLWFTVCVVLGLGALVAGFAVPIHLRAVDACVLECAGKGTPSLSERGAELLRENRLGAAQMLAQVAQRQHLPDSETLQGLVDDTLKRHPDWQAWGQKGPDHAELKIPMDLSVAMKSKKGPLFTMAMSFNNKGPFGGFYRYIGEEDTFKVYRDDMTDSDANASGVTTTFTLDGSVHDRKATMIAVKPYPDEMPGSR